ncbi:hypothetical protein K431DRAFT_308934 [Polychaeton citri CBS 116435]|uniref:Uncharacterized protein n=1 Tax=Polychaeton citri CBS 116435 TaxID=1314669 RepID=A0A9P4URQ9_9PEZI|nr:hypothetical protein K431DRAFT_308934 [Polychaeton citri CBS 116435]
MDVIPADTAVGVQMGDVAEISRRPKRQHTSEETMQPVQPHRRGHSVVDSDVAYPRATDYDEEINLSAPEPVYFSSHASDPLAQHDEAEEDFVGYQDVDQQLSADPAKLEMQDLAQDEERKDNRRIMKSAVISGIITFTFTTLGTWWWTRGQEDMKDLGKMTRNETVMDQLVSR